MNKLEQEHLDAIEATKELLSLFGEPIYSVNEDNAAKSCASITILYMKGFAKFLINHEIKSTSGWIELKVDEFSAKNTYYSSTEELIQLYFKSNK